MEKIIGNSMKTYFRLRSFRTELWKNNPLPNQELILFDIIQNMKYTQWGKQHEYESITTIGDYQNGVPISRYEDISPYIEKMRNGETDVLWPGIVKYFSKSSGTTNDISKYIPVSEELLRDNMFRSGRDFYCFYFKLYPDSRLFEDRGCILSLGGNLDSENEHGINSGDVSAVLTAQLPKWVQRYRKPSISVALMQHWREKIPAIFKDAKDTNVTHLLGVPTWFIPLFEHAQEETGMTVREIWPNLELFIHGAVSFDPYRELFKKYLGDHMHYMETYNASEGFFAVQDDLSLPGEMCLMTAHGIFYEFIPMTVYGTDDEYAITLREVKLGINYAMVISTNSGLARYDIGDTVMFTCLEPFRIKVTGRTKHYINICGEELMVGNAEAAIAQVCFETNAVVRHYTAGPIYLDDNGKGGHEWIIEFEKSPQDLELFQQKLDETLQSLNSDYRAKRQDDIVFQNLKLTIVSGGTFEKWLEEKGKLGGQHKVPKLSNTRKYLEEIL